MIVVELWNLEIINIKHDQSRVLFIISVLRYVTYYWVECTAIILIIYIYNLLKYHKNLRHIFVRYFKIICSGVVSYYCRKILKQSSQTLNSVSFAVFNNILSIPSYAVCTYVINLKSNSASICNLSYST